MVQRRKDPDKFNEFLESDKKELRRATNEHLETLVQKGLENLKDVGQFVRIGGKAFQKGYAAAIILDERYGQDHYVGLFNKKK